MNLEAWKGLTKAEFLSANFEVVKIYLAKLVLQSISKRNLESLNYLV